MSTLQTARFACATPYFVEDATEAELTDWLSYFAPDVVLVTGDAPAPRAVSTLRRLLDDSTEWFHPSGNGPASGPRVINEVQCVFAPTHEVLDEIQYYEHSELDPDDPTYVISNHLELDVDKTNLTASLHGLDEYTTALDQPRLDGDYIHISTRLPATYRHDWNGLRVIGGGVNAGTAETPLTALDCRTNGQVLKRELRRSQLGLRALDQVGKKRARRLREAGFRTREDVAVADRTDIAGLSGIGDTIAERIQQSATAVAHDNIVRLTEKTLPSGDPVYMDIETDGLNPTITWLIGVLDGSAEEGRYMPFLQTDPDHPGRAIEDFMSWYTANASHRPLVAYRGWGFDFDVLHDHIVEYCPQYEEDWTSTYRFDPYTWAVEEGNAILPGRTNTLDDVAEALGYERGTSDVTGAAVARAYRRWMAEDSPAVEPDWNRCKQYCEDDVRALATVFEALADSGRIVSEADPARNVSETTTQGSLSDW